MRRRKQCDACPWKVSTVPDRDIPGGYSRELHEGLRCTVADPSIVRLDSIRMMACHEFPVGHEQPCVGWVMNQLGPGNNLSLRLLAMDGRFDRYELDGEQHETFEATLGEP